MNAAGAVDLDVLVCVCRHPYTTVSVLAGLLGRPDRVVDYALHKLLDADLVGRKSYESIHLARSYVYYAQVEGLNTAARSRKESVQDMVRRLGASYRQMRWTAQRLDFVTPLYLFAATISRAYRRFETGSEENREGGKPATVLLYSSGVYDAIVTLPGNRTIGVVRQSHGRSRSQLTDRFFGMTPGERRKRRPPYRPGKAIVLTDTPWEARVVRADRDWQWMGPPPLHVEHGDSRTLLDPGHVARTLVHDLPPSRAQPPPVVRRSNPSVPSRKQLEEIVQERTFRLSCRDKEILETVAELTLISGKELATYLGREDTDGLSRPSMSGIKSKLVNELGVLEEIGGRGAKQYALSADGIDYTVNVNRLRPEVARDIWSCELVRDEETGPGEDGDGPLRYRGSRPNRVLQYPGHTRGVYSLISRLKRGIEALSPYLEFGWVLSTHRTRRDYSDTRIEPDALLECVYHTPLGEPVRVPIMVEYERRDIHPGRSRRRLNRYSRYFREGQCQTDHGGLLPTILFVFDDERAERRFIETATSMQLRLPLLTSNMELLARVAPSHFMLANAWWSCPWRGAQAARYTLAGRIHLDRRSRLANW